MDTSHLPDLLAARTLPALSHEELVRYGRHLSLPEVGMAGQQRLKASRVLLVGLGGLGSPLALYLAAAGVGRLGLVDHDVVEASNLQRQVLYGTGDVGQPKVEIAKRRVAEVNPLIRVETHPVRFSEENARALVESYDVIVDGSDNFPTRYLVNDACVLYRKPLVWGAVERFEGQVAVFWSQHGPCYRCLFPRPPAPGTVPNCAEAGVLGVLPGVVGTLQATEVIKLLLGEGDSLLGRLLVVDALGGASRAVRLAKNERCPICGPEATIDGLATAAETCEVDADPVTAQPVTAEAASDDVDHADATPFEIDVQQLRRWRDEGRELVVLDVRETYEHEIGRIEGSVLIPLGQIPERATELDRDILIVAQCHHGVRSAQAVAFLRQQGFARVTNLAGGIDAWSLEVDPSVPRY